MWERVRGILFESLGLKIASVLLALLLYAHVVTDQEREQVVQIPIAAVGLADSLTSVGKLPPRIAAKVRGKWKDLIRLSLTRPFLSIDLASAKPGMFRTAITSEDISRRAIPPELSRLVTITEVLDPRSVDLAIEAKATRSLPVRARIVGTPALGYVLDKVPEVDPDSVRVMGPARLVQEIDTLYTEAVDITGERERIQRQVSLALPANVENLETRRCVVTIRLAREDSDSLPDRP
ncbi:MAG TPA: YbbR-like domain-containing protein [Candidatus Polarisedimenticolia bacterium]|nr:YbbR-like domain-containing protein [Candidatus Polarisedimenticolia bacterium]